MVYLGWILRLALVVTLLPWGAYSAAAARPAPASAVGLLQALNAAPSGAAHAVMAQTAPTDRIAPQPRRCKTGILGHLRCAPDAALSGSLPLVAPTHQPETVTALPLPTGASRREAPPHRPPRLRAVTA